MMSLNALGTCKVLLQVRLCLPTSTSNSPQQQLSESRSAATRKGHCSDVGHKRDYQGRNGCSQPYQLNWNICAFSLSTTGVSQTLHL